MRRIPRRREGVVLAAALLAASSPAAMRPAQAQAVQAASSYLARMDTSDDGRVSLVEYQAWMGYAFDAMDRDHDGVLSPAELPGGHGAALTRNAHRARLAAVFARQDRDRDGFLDLSEFAAPPR